MEPIEDINGFSNLVFIDGRSFDNLKERMITQVRVPARVLQIGLKPNGFPYAILQVTAKEKPVREKKAPPSVADASIVVEPGTQPN
jgi:hypothetical protein